MSNDSIRLDSIQAAIGAMAAGQAVVVVDDADRENEGDIIFAAEFATPELMGWTIRHSSGVLCTPMSGERADAMGLPPMVVDNQDAKGTAYTVSCDAAHGTSTGISAADRALTSRVLADPASGPELINRPGHIFPLRAVDGGVLVRRGHTEASVDLCRAADLEPVAVIAELVHDDGSMMRLPALREFADVWNIPLVSIEDLAAWRATSDAEPAVATSAAAVQGGPEVRIPTPHGEFMVRAWRERDNGTEHLSLSAAGPDGQMPSEPLVRVHSECLTGDVLGSYRCDCGEQLAAGLQAINEYGGVLVYLRGHEGRGIGLANKIRAYALQDGGANTVAANEQLGLPVDARNYDAAAAILNSLSIRRIRLITNNPLKEQWLEHAGIAVSERVPTRVAARPENLEYLRTKQELLHHSLQLPTTETTTPGAKS
ncbi:MAG: 3,4-dihydroxy-2-butanone-4-phosphate synthase [Micrococcaceae bacterium]|nr:3,4-dihydroxy-2-butanone-4-phosphate synthase [Micrococcaceae bacterium]